MMQAYCRLLGVSPAPQELADLSAVAGALGPDHPLTRVMKRAKDFSHPDALADALLNPRERGTSVPELFDWLARCGLVFGRWREQAPYLPQCGTAAPRPHAARLRARSRRRTNMPQWSFCVERWTGIASPPSATTIPPARRRSTSPAKARGLCAGGPAVVPSRPRGRAKRVFGGAHQSEPSLSRPRAFHTQGRGATACGHRRGALDRRNSARRRGRAVS